jgi:hypothetical protein
MLILKKLGGGVLSIILYSSQSTLQQQRYDVPSSENLCTQINDNFNVIFVLL